MTAGFKRLVGSGAIVFLLSFGLGACGAAQLDIDMANAVTLEGDARCEGHALVSIFGLFEIGIGGAVAAKGTTNADASASDGDVCAGVSFSLGEWSYTWFSDDQGAKASCKALAGSHVVDGPLTVVSKKPGVD